MNILAKILMLGSIVVAVLSFPLNTIALFAPDFKTYGQGSIFLAAIMFAIAMLWFQAQEKQSPEAN